MEKQARQMLKYVMGKSKEKPLIHITDVHEEFGRLRGMSLFQTEACVNYLLEEGYISFPPNFISFRPTHKAYQKSSFTREQIKEILFKSIFLPIFVSALTAAITTMVTLWITGIVK